MTTETTTESLLRACSDVTSLTAKGSFMDGKDADVLYELLARLLQEVIKTTPPNYSEASDEFVAAYLQANVLLAACFTGIRERIASEVFDIGGKRSMKIMSLFTMKAIKVWTEEGEDDATP